MPTYITLLRFTQQGIEKIKESPARLERAKAAIARRLVLRMPFGPVYPNLWIAWIAPTTLHTKSSALDIARGIAHRVFPQLLAPQESTPEAMLADMAGQEPVNINDMPETSKAIWTSARHHAGQRGLVLDELSGLLGAAGKDYNTGLVESFLRFYDCYDEYRRSTRKGGQVVVRNAYLTFLGVSTPVSVAQHMVSERLWAMGWWPRFAILSPAANPEWKTPTDLEEPEAIVDALRHLLAWLPTTSWPDPPPAVSVCLADGVYEGWEVYNKAMRYDLLKEYLDSHLWGSYGRLPTQALKIATCLAAVDRDRTGGVVITQDHLDRAIRIAEDWRSSAHRLVDSVAAANFQNTYQSLGPKILKILAEKEPEGATQREICKRLRKSTPDEVSETLRQLEVAGLVERCQAQAPIQRGRPSNRYRIANQGGG